MQVELAEQAAGDSAWLPAGTLLTSANSVTLTGTPTTSSPVSWSMTDVVTPKAVLGTEVSRRRLADTVRDVAWILQGEG